MLSDVIYTLKREFPATIILVSQESMQRDFDSGKMEVSSTEYRIERAVVLPKQLSPLATNQLGENERAILIDANDVWFTITKDFKVKFEEVVWDIIKINSHENKIIELVIRNV